MSLNKTFLLLIFIAILSISVSAVTVVVNSTVNVVDNSIDDYNTYRFSSQGFKFYAATSELWFSDYPFIELNSPTLITFRVLRDSDYNFIIDDCVSAKLTLNGNETFNLTYDNSLKGYKIGLLFDSVDDIPFTAKFYRAGEYIKDFKGTFKIRKFANLSVQFFSDDNSTVFNKKNSVLIAYSEARMKMTDSAYYTNIISTINNVNDYLYKTLGIPNEGKTWLRMYAIYPTAVFYGFLLDGRTTIRVPVNESMTLRLLGGKASDTFVLSGNAYATLYHKELRFDVALTNLQVKRDKYLELVVTDWDTSFASTLGAWILRIISIIIVIGLPITLYAYTGNSQLAWNVFGILFVTFGVVNLGFEVIRSFMGL
jgi:hypothetical protein